MTVYFVDRTTKPGDQLHYSSLSLRPYLSQDKPLVIIDLASYSDYSGSDVERSNRRVILADSELAPHVVRLIGSHGTKGLGYFPTDDKHPEDGHSVPEPLRDAIAALDNYPILDDDDHSELEAELETEAWDDYGRDDFREALVAVLDELDAEHEHEIPDDDEPYSGISPDNDVCSEPETWKTMLWDLWRAGCDALNVNGGSGFAMETGGGVHFYTAYWKAKAGLDKRYPTDKAIHGVLRALAIETRTQG